MAVGEPHGNAMAMQEPATEACRGRNHRRARGLLWGVLSAGALGAAVAIWGLVHLRSHDESEVAALYRAGSREEAMARVAKWLARSPRSAEAYVWKARLALALRRGDDASDALERARMLEAPRAELDRLRAIAAAIGGDFAAAEPVLRQAFNERQDDPLIDELLTRIYLETYDIPRARVALKRWVLDAPADAKPYLWRAEMDMRAADVAGALADYREALRRNPRSAPAQLGLATELHKSHRNAEAVEAFNAYMKLKPDDPAGLIGAGRIAVEAGELDAATRYLERALSLAPDDPEVHHVLADLLTRNRDPSSALMHLDRAVALDPFDLETRHARGRVLSLLGRADEAAAEQARAARLRAEQSTMFSAQAKLVATPNDLASKLVIARWLFSHGKAPEGVRWAEAIVREKPGQPDACQLLAEHYDGAGKPGLANFYRAQAMEESPARARP
jgi:predicted Zn-dependent protease